MQQQTNNKQQTTIFSAKNESSIFETNFTKSEGKVRFGQFFFENDPLDEPNQMPPSKKFYPSRKLVKNAKWWSKSNLPSQSLTLLTAKNKPKSAKAKVATNNNNNNNNNKRPFFLPKINKVFLRPILQNLKGRSVLDNFF